MKDLVQAIDNEDLDEVRRITEQKGVNIKWKNIRSNKALQYSAAKGCLSVVRYFLEQQLLDVNTEANGGWTPLLLATKNGHTDVVDYLLEKKANVHSKTESGGWTALHLASESGFLEIVKLLVDHGADVDSPNSKRFTPLHRASQRNHVNIVNYLLNQGADIQATEIEDGMTPLFLACLNGHIQVVRLLVQTLLDHSGMTINSPQSSSNGTALHVSCFFGQLEVVQYLIEECEANDEIKDCDGHTPLEVAEKEKNKLIIFYFHRRKLSAIFNRNHRNPVEITPQYLEHIIRRDKPLGNGFYGDVYKACDPKLGREFAVKLVKREIIESASPQRIDGIIKSFKNEANILSKLNHPNIAQLFGFCRGTNDDQSTVCLLYELAPNGSLDKFWQDDLGRSRLSSPKVRIRIAYDVAKVLRYMHEALDGGAKCFHRDIKSANVCLAEDMSARVIDCGLSKYIQESEGICGHSSVGATGTKGYICPLYNQDEIPFESACDVFSFGIFLCELITGKVTSQGNTHYTVYERKKCRHLKDDVDKIVDWEDEVLLKRFVILAESCIKTEASERPKISEVVEELRDMFFMSEEDEGSSLIPAPHEDEQSEANRCRICGSINQACVQCRGSIRHTHCASCVERSFMSAVISQERHPQILCLKEGCDSPAFDKKEVLRLISPNTWAVYSMLETKLGRTINRMEASLWERPPCPTLFVLVNVENHRRWQNLYGNNACTKFYLYFVCEHSFTPVSDKSRIKIRYMKSWLKKVAPAFNMSLLFLQFAVGALGMQFPAESMKLSDMDSWAKELLDPTDRSVLEKADISSGLEKNTKRLVDPALKLVAEKANEHMMWRTELVRVFDKEKNREIYVKPEFKDHGRYQHHSSSTDDTDATDVSEN